MSESNWILKLNPENIQKSAAERASEILTLLDKAPSSSGRELLKKYMLGNTLLKSAAIKAKCCECSAHYIDGRADCEIHTCPLYPYMPYGKFRKRYVRPDRKIQENKEN